MKMQYIAILNAARAEHGRLGLLFMTHSQRWYNLQACEFKLYGRNNFFEDSTRDAWLADQPTRGLVYHLCEPFWTLYESLKSTTRM